MLSTVIPRSYLKILAFNNISNYVLTTLTVFINKNVLHFHIRDWITGWNFRIH